MVFSFNTSLGLLEQIIVNPEYEILTIPVILTERLGHGICRWAVYNLDLVKTNSLIFHEESLTNIKDRRMLNLTYPNIF